MHISTRRFGVNRRLILTALPAAAITFGLAMGMRALITVDDVNLKEESQRKLVAFTPQFQDAEAHPKRPKPKLLKTASKPPPPPKFSTTNSDIDLPTPIIQEAPPTEVGFVRSEFPLGPPIVVSDRKAQPIRPPSPTYPTRAAERGIEGNCNVKFDVDSRGRPFNIVAECTDQVFKREAERSVGKVEFAPKIVRGKPVERRNVIFPIQFGLDG